MQLTDYGLSKDVSRRPNGRYIVDASHHTGEDQEMPILWMPPEALTPDPKTLDDGLSYSGRVFSRASDVWALGVALWEVATDGGFPYYMWAVGDAELVRRLVVDRRTMNPPTAAQGCPDNFARVMQQCWSYAPGKRPTAAHLADALGEIERQLARKW